MAKHKKLLVGIAAGWLLALVFPPTKLFKPKSA